MSKHNRERRRLRALLKSGRLTPATMHTLGRLRLRKHGKQVLAGRRTVTLTRAEAASGLPVPRL